MPENTNIEEWVTLGTREFGSTGIEQLPVVFQRIHRGEFNPASPTTLYETDE
jgi:hypothetical protein